MRTRPSKILRMVLSGCLAVFVIMNIHLLMFPSNSNSDPSNNEYLDEGAIKSRDILYNSNIGILDEKTQKKDNLPKEVKRNKAVEELIKKQNDSTLPKITIPIQSHHIDTSNISMIKSAMHEVNFYQRIRNAETVNFQLTNDSVIVLVQVHNRPEYLKHLVESLRIAKDIHKTLLVFSHDYFSNELNDIILTIDFCPVMQIFYPYSMQIYPDEFPGKSPNDCPRDIKKDKALEIKCNNAEHPDKYGHYREARYAQTKHHWFWKSHRVFDELKVTKDFNGLVLLLEEDHFVTPDFIHTLRLMKSLRDNEQKAVSILTLGTYDKKPTYGFLASKGLIEYLKILLGFATPERIASAEIMEWFSSKHNMGMALDRTTWQKIVQCTKDFCTFDDYNWDWTLQYISAKCIPGRLKVMVAKSPRIFHIGECGVHHKGKDCHPDVKVKQINQLLKDSKNYLFPREVAIQAVRNKVERVPKGNGGWGDIRDHELCMSFISDKKQR